MSESSQRGLNTPGGWRGRQIPDGSGSEKCPQEEGEQKGTHIDELHLRQEQEFREDLSGLVPPTLHPPPFKETEDVVGKRKG